MTGTILIILVVLHFVYHLVASVGVFIGLIHSHRVHKKNVWKIIAAVGWLAISLLILFLSGDIIHTFHTCS